MKILVINAGSSSVKFTLFRMADECVLAGGVVERIGLDGTQAHYRTHRGDTVQQPIRVADTFETVAEIAAFLTHKKKGVIGTIDEIAAIGHRVVHGGEKINTPVIVDDTIKDIIRKCSSLAPLHNPPNLKGIEASEKYFPGIPNIAVFDTAFHATLPEHAYLYGLPYHLYREDKIRRYGFHGTSHRYVSRRAAKYLNRPLSDLKIITCHIGNGSSITAVDGGKSIDTSMGLTPLEGILMGTRCGTIDPAIVVYLMTQKKLKPEEIDELLNKKSGFLGMAEINSSDVRDVLSAMAAGNARATAAVHLFTYQTKKYIGAYTAAMNGLDALVFTAGIGENSPFMRERICNSGQGLEFLDIRLDPVKNRARGIAPFEIQADHCRIKIIVIRTDEEKEIARQVRDLMGSP